jgi:hypothetical protein
VGSGWWRNSDTLNGALVDAALWIASSEAPKRTHREALGAFQALLEGLLQR